MKLKNFVLLTAICSAFVAWSCEDVLLNTDLPKPPPPSVRASRLATVLDSLRYALDLPALAGAIVTDTGVVEAQAVGCRRYGGAANVTNSDLFHLGSCTKAFTATLLAVLVDEGKVGWNSTLPEIFPEYVGTMRPEYRSITLRDLLSNSAGFSEYVGFKPKSSTPGEQREEVVAWALSQPPASERGRYHYSDVGYSIAGAIAEKLANHPYEQLLIEKVMQPLGITSAGFGPMGTPGEEDQPLQHTNAHAVIQPTPDADNLPLYNSSGRLHISIGDWARFIHWVLAAKAGNQTLLRPETARTLLTGTVAVDASSRYAMGWQIYDYLDWAGSESLTHGGSNSFNYAIADVAPDRHFGIVIATNQGPGISANPLNPVQWCLINLYLHGQ